MPGHGAIEVNARLRPRHSGSDAALPIERSFLTNLKYYLLSGPAHPNHPLFASFKEDTEYEEMQKDNTYRARCLLQQMTGLDVIPFGSDDRLTVSIPCPAHICILMMFVRLYFKTILMTATTNL
jgi:hypothetical protein